MAEPYTPTTDEVREDWSRVPGYLIDPAAARMSDQRQAAFDRWLAAHDREVAVRTLRDLGLSPRPHISATLPDRVRRLYDADLRERSIRAALDLAADLIARYAVVIARADQIEKEDDRG